MLTIITLLLTDTFEHIRVTIRLLYKKNCEVIEKNFTRCVTVRVEELWYIDGAAYTVTKTHQSYVVISTTNDSF